jgi:hypothetical protein
MNDKLETWKLSKNLDIPRSRLIPLLEALGLTVSTDPDGSPWVSQSAMRSLLFELADQDKVRRIPRTGLRPAR